MKKTISVILAVCMTMSISVMSFAMGNGNGAIGQSQQVESSRQLMQDQLRQGRIEIFQGKKADIETQKADIAQKKAAFQTKRDEFNAYRVELNEKRAAAIKAMKENNQVRAENMRLHHELKNSLKALKLDGVVLSDEVMDALNEYKIKIGEIRTELESTKNQIQSIRQLTGDYRSAKDYVSLEAAFDEIYVIQQYRNDCLTQINQIFQQMLQLLVSEA